MNYHILLLPLIALVLAQGMKPFIGSNKLHFSFRNFFAYSGMPSGHSALVVSAATIIGLETGFDSAQFALAFILAIVVLRDAMGIRRYLGEHGKMLNILISDLKNDNVLEQQYPHLIEKIGHTPLQVLAGSLIGLVVSLAGYIIFK